MSALNIIIGILIIWLFLLGPTYVFLLFGYVILSNTGIKATIKSIDDVSKNLTVSYTNDSGNNNLKNVKYDGPNVYSIGQIITVYQTADLVSQGPVVLNKPSTIPGWIMIFIGLLFVYAIYFIIKKVILV
jgi:hypothetical protein